MESIELSKIEMKFLESDESCQTYPNRAAHLITKFSFVNDVDFEQTTDFPDWLSRLVV